MSQTNNRKYREKAHLYQFKDKQSVVDDYTDYMLARTNSMFKWTGLPDTVPAWILELYLQTNGNVVWYKDGNNLYVFIAGLGGEPDVYYMPTIATISNPALNLSVQSEIHKECEVMYNDSVWKGLLPLISKYSSMLAENELSINVAQIVGRLQYAISAEDDRTKKSAEQFIKGLIEGNIEVIGESKFLDNDLKTLPIAQASTTGSLKSYIEMEQYIKASLFQELGLSANYNMKREALSSSESSINNDILFPLVDDMLKQRKEGCDRVNAMFGTNISVEFNSSWEDNAREEEAVVEQLENEAEGEEENSDEISEAEVQTKENKGEEEQTDAESEVTDGDKSDETK